MPDSNPMTGLFNLCSCPNYTYEIGAWISFTIMTQVGHLGFLQSISIVCIQCLPAAFFTMAGAYQMTMWALGKHRYLSVDHYIKCVESRSRQIDSTYFCHFK